jgi:AraC-like DNA-binding protein
MLAPIGDRAIVHVVDAILGVRPALGGNLRALATVADSDEMRLRQALRSVLGLPASRFLLRRRMMLAQAALDAGAGDIDTVARAHGFARTERFVAAYRAMFGARPVACH